MGAGLQGGGLTGTPTATGVSNPGSTGVVSSGLGSGASDVVVEVGSTVADASVNAAAKLLSVRTGIGGTEVEKAYFLKSGKLVIDLGGVTNVDGLQVVNAGGGSGVGINVAYPSSVGAGFGRGNNGNIVYGATNAVSEFRSFGLGAGSKVLLYADSGANSGDRSVVIGSAQTDAATNAAAKLASFGTDVTGTYGEKAWVVKDGTVIVGGDVAFGEYLSSRTGVAQGQVAWNLGATELGIYNATGSAFLGINTTTGDSRCSGALALTGLLNQSGTDSTGSPGAATINKPIGKSAIAAGASSVVITNSLCTAASHIIITPHARDATCKELIAVAAAGSFTVSGTANATAALPFSWRIATMI